MTRKDYETIAKGLNEYRSYMRATTQENRIRKDTLDDVVDILCEVFGKGNAMFSSDRFRSACIPNHELDEN
jgi:hypothetical protein